jgi:CheY-like chemotaxis protein
MPDISGMEVLRRIRALAEKESLPVLIYTSKHLTEAEREQVEALRAQVLRKEDVSTRLSAQPFFDWLAGAGLSPDSVTSQTNG